jgi:AmiR/NasT family two-component response regulator
VRRYAPVCRAAVSPTDKNTATEDVWLWHSLALRVAGFDFPNSERRYEMVSLSHPDEYATNEGRIVSTSGFSIDVNEYERTFEEHQGAGIEAAARLCQLQSVPVILVSANHNADLIARAMADHVMAYLVKPINQAVLATTIALAVRRCKEFTAWQHQATNVRRAFEDRNVIERAKGILMKRAGLDEANAFRRLRKLASDKNVKLVRLAEMIGTAQEAMQ